jgi:teichuronic acid exporter
MQTVVDPRTLKPVEQTPLDSRVNSGLRWSLARQFITGIVGTAGMLAYTRLLQPEDLGAVALAFLAYSGLLLLVQAPIRDAVVYYRDEGVSHPSAAFWLLLGFSTVAVILVMTLAGRLGRFYESPHAAGLTRGIAVAFFFHAVAVVPASLLLKRFQFAVHESLQTAFVLILLIGWVGLAVAGLGPWSLVIPQVVGAVFLALAMWIAAGFRPILHPGQRAYRDVIRFSLNLLGSKLLIYLKGNIDNAAVGTLGEGPLGWYSFGEDQSTFVAFGVGATVAQVALPAMAAARERIEKIRQIYLDMLRLTATLSTPMQIGAIILADLGISLFFGEQWLGAVPVFRAYLAFRLLSTLLAISDAAISALGRPDVRFVLDLVQFPFFVAGVWFGLQVWGGIAGVAWSLAVVRAVMGLVYFGATMRVIDLKVGDTLRYLLPSSSAGMLMGLIVYVMRRAGVLSDLWASIAQPLLADALEVSILTLTGATSYFAILFALDRSGFKTVAAMALQIVLPESLRTRLAATRGLSTRPISPTNSNCSTQARDRS